MDAGSKSEKIGSSFGVATGRRAEASHRGREDLAPKFGIGKRFGAPSIMSESEQDVRRDDSAVPPKKSGRAARLEWRRHVVDAERAAPDVGPSTVIRMLSGSGATSFPRPPACADRRSVDVVAARAMGRRFVGASRLVGGGRV
jgi:hypothetical protein